jgi:type I restriction enzyme, S subunit
MRMNKKNKTTLVPKLRFPEFKSAKEWVEKPLGDVTYTVSQKNSEGKKYPIYSINNKKGFLPQSDQFEGVDSNLRGYDIRLYKIVDKNTFAYNPARINVGSIGYSGELFDIIISSLYVCFKTNGEIEDNFLHCFLATSTFKRQVENNTEGGIRSYLFYENFSKILLQFPEKHEQQKIAECLSSLDDLITAENRKLEALKTHKIGLMQKLFPAEGKTVPEWRFSDFKDSGEWVIKTLGQLGELVSGLTYSPDDIREKGLLVLRSSNIKNNVITLDDNVYVRTDISGANLSFENDILICVRNGSKALIGKNAIIPKDMPLSTHGAFMTVFRSKFSKFVFQLLQSRAYDKQVRADLGATINSINRTQLEKYVFYIPKDIKEQEKIANCLSALDTLITAQAEKIESLKVHKKGLMQGLFPSFEEVSE